MCICVAYCLVDWALTTIVETQPIVQKYSKEGFLKAPWCLIKRFFHFIALPFWRSYPRSLISLPNTRHILYLKLPRELIFQNISSFIGNILVCVCFSFASSCLKLGVVYLDDLIIQAWVPLTSSESSSILSIRYTYNSYRVELCSCIDVNVEYRDWC